MRPVALIPCGFCAKLIPINNNRKRKSQPQTCSQACSSRLFWRQAKTPVLKKDCSFCGKCFTSERKDGKREQYPNQFRKRKFCGTTCAINAKKIDYGNTIYPNIFCRHCGHLCAPNRKLGIWYHVRRKYCSGACNSNARWAKSNDFNATKRCVICRKTFSQRAPWGTPHAPHIWAKKTTCSTACTNRFTAKQRLHVFPQRFMSNVEKEGHNGCWRWVGSFLRKDKTKFASNYGVIVWPARGNIAAHRASYELYVGKIPKGKVVRHTCDHPWCVFPTHLILGTRADNVQDMVDRDRQWKGPRKRGYTVSRLSTLDVERAILLYATGRHTHKSIGKILGKHPSTIQAKLAARGVKVMSHKQKLLAQSKSIDVTLEP